MAKEDIIRKLLLLAGNNDNANEASEALQKATKFAKEAGLERILKEYKPRRSSSPVIDGQSSYEESEEVRQYRMTFPEMAWAKYVCILAIDFGFSIRVLKQGKKIIAYILYGTEQQLRTIQAAYKVYARYCDRAWKIPAISRKGLVEKFNDAVTSGFVNNTHLSHSTYSTLGVICGREIKNIFKGAK